MDTDKKYYRGIDGNPIKEPVAICHFNKHRGYLTPSMIKTHGCLKRDCSRLQKLDCQYWQERKQRKSNSRMAKQDLLEKKI